MPAVGRKPAVNSRDGDIGEADQHDDHAPASVGKQGRSRSRADDRTASSRPAKRGHAEERGRSAGGNGADRGGETGRRSPARLPRVAAAFSGPDGNRTGCFGCTQDAANRPHTATRLFFATQQDLFTATGYYRAGPTGKVWHN